MTLVGDRLFLHLSLIGVQRNRRRTNIFAAAQRFTGPFLTRVGERIAHDVLALLRWTADFDERILLCEIQQILDTPGGSA